jgi:predicted ATPase
MPATGITSLEVENFRCFKKLNVPGLTPVSLFVGANNAGKTTLLEAIEAVASTDSPFLLYRASFERGEFRRRPGPGEDVVEIDLRHWFYGHRLDEGATFALRATGSNALFVQRTIQRVPAELGAPFTQGGFMLSIERPGSRARLPPLPLTEDNLLGAGPASRFGKHGLRLKPPVGFVTTDHLFPSELLPIWTSVVLTPGEQRTVEALRLVEPSVDRIAISGSRDAVSPQVLLRGDDAPVPLGSLGEGVSRILTLALHLAATQGGVLLIDEIESGLHWSALPKVWRFLVETARILDVQVFATTHSKDCIEALAELHRMDPVLAQRVTVHRLEAGRESSLRFDAGRIAEYVEMDLESR